MMTLRSIRNRLRSGVSLVALLAGLGAGCAQAPITPATVDVANTEAWFAGGFSVPLRDFDRERFVDARTARDRGNAVEALERFRALAEDGYPQAAYEIGKMYRYGRGVAADPTEAARWLMAAMVRPHEFRPMAARHLGELFADGSGVVRNDGLAHRLLTFALDNGDAAAAPALAQLVAQGRGAPADGERARELLADAPEPDDPRQLLFLAEAHGPGGLLGENPAVAAQAAAKARALLVQAAEAEGDAGAMIQLGHLARRGVLGPPDLDAAIAWYQRAADAGSPDPLVGLALDLVRDPKRPGDVERGTALIEMAAVRYRNPRAQLERARGLLAAGPAHEDYGAGRDLVEEAAARGEPLAWRELGRLSLGRTASAPATATQGEPTGLPDGIALLRRAYQAGVTGAAADLGLAYLEGIGTAKNPAEAERLLKEAAASGDLSATYRLGLAYLAGTELPADPAQGERLLSKAAEGGQAEARFQLGRAYLKGDRIPRRPDLAAGLLAGITPDQMLVLARDFRDGTGTRVDLAQSLAWFDRAAAAGAQSARQDKAALLFHALAGRSNPSRLREAAGLGHVGAMAALGRALVDGTVAGGAEEGAGWLRRAAAGGNAGAAALLGRTLLYGQRGIGRDVSAGRRYLEQAAARGDIAARRDLGQALIDGTVLPADPARGLSLLRQAAQAGDPPAMRLYGQVLTEGRGGRADQAAGTQWLRRAAEAGDSPAMAALGKSYLDQGKDLTEARAWLERAVDLGDQEARMRLGAALVEGTGGLPIDREAGQALLQKAADAGHPGTLATLGRLHLRGAFGRADRSTGVAYLVKAARAGQPSARYDLAEAFLKARGLEKTNRAAAERWLDGVLAGDTTIAIQTLSQMLTETASR